MTFASRSVAGTTTRYSRLRPAAEVSVTCIGIALGGRLSRTSWAAFSEKTSALLVRAEGLEPPRLSSREPKSRASTNSATPATAGRPGGAAYIMRNPQDTSKIGIGARLATQALCGDHGCNAWYMRRQSFGQILGNETGPERACSLAVHPHRGRGGFECRHSLRQQSRCDPGQYVAGTGRRQISRRVRSNCRPAIRGRDNGIGAFEEDDRARYPRRQTRSFELRSDFSSLIQPTEITGKFALVRR